MKHKRKVYMLMHSINSIYGGLTRASINHAQIFTKLGHKVEILLVGGDRYDAFKINELYRTGQLDRQTKITCMYDDLKTKPDTGKDRYEFDFLEKYSSVVKGQYHQQQLFYREDETLKYELKYAPKNHCIQKLTKYCRESKNVKNIKVFDEEGCLFKQTKFQLEPYVIIKDEYYNCDGTIHTTVNYKEVSEEEVEVSEVSSRLGKFANLDQLKAKWLNEKITEFNPIIIAQTRPVDPALLLSSLNQENIYVVTHVNHLDPEDKTKLNMRYIPMFTQDNWKILTFTNKQKSDIIVNYEYPEEKVIVIPHGIKKQEVPRKLKREKVIVIVARFDEAQKNFKDMIIAFKYFYKNNPDYHLEIYGFGPDRELILELIHANNLEKMVTIMDFTQNIGEVYLEAEMSLCASKQEAFCLSVAESISYGCPVASYDIDYGPTEIITPKSGAISKENTPEALAITMQEVLELNKKYTGRKIAREVEKYSESSVERLWKKELK